MSPSIKTYATIMALFFSLVFISCEEEEENPGGQLEVPTENASIGLANDATFGSILVDGEGNTLYFFAKDANGSSACNGGCAEAWPPFFEENLIVQTGLDEDDFGVITREDGSQQTTFKGWPLYFFANDEQSGDINGDGVGNVWFVGKPDYRVMVANQVVDDTEITYLVDYSGNTLYRFTVDEPNVSNCTDGCAEVWPPFYSPYEAVPSIISEANISAIDREDGQNVTTGGSDDGYGENNSSANSTANNKQNTFKSQPLYLFSNDNARGDTNGQGVNNVWFVVDDLD